VKVPFLFIRHGETDWNAKGILQGRSDVPLNAQGMQQAEEAAKILESVAFDVIVTSPLQRALQTAVCLAERCHKPWEPHDGLQERYFGYEEGQPKAEVLARYAFEGQAVPKLPLPGAEPYDDVITRAVSTVKEVLESHAGQTVLLVGHSTFFQALYEALTGNPLPEKGKNGVPVRFSPHGEGEWTCEEVQ
jgi:probable phosphoglycerate mutase/uncharacterized phosphatase